jgi:hypothetical protein
MKQMILRSLAVAALVSTSAAEAGAADYKLNPFTLTYDGAITKNEQGKVNMRQATEARAQESAGGEVPYAANKHLSDEQIAKLPFDLYRQGFEYCGKTHAHPNSSFKYTMSTMSSLLDLMRFDATDQIELIDQPLLMIAGSKADSLDG